MVQLVVSDLDGTLVNSDLEGYTVSNSIIDMVDRLQKNGVYFTIATGRETMAAKPTADLLSLSCPFITFNGAQLVSPHGEVLYGSYVDLSKWSSMIKKIDSLGGQVIVCEGNDAYCLRRSDRIKIFEEKQKITCSVIEHSRISKIKTSKLLFLGDTALFRSEIAQSTYLCENFELITSEDDYLEIVNKGINKGRMLKTLIEYLCIAGEVLTLGNHLNDLELLKEADIGVAVANAAEGLKQHADYIAQKAYHEGVIEAVDRFVFN